MASKIFYSLLSLLLLAACSAQPTPSVEPYPTLASSALVTITNTPTRLVPTASPAGDPTATLTVAPTAMPTVALLATPTVALTATPRPTPPPSNVAIIEDRERWGVSGSMAHAAAAYDLGLLFGSYFNWTTEQVPAGPAQANFWQMIRLHEDGFRQSWSEIEAIIARQPGSIWVIGNEPDVVVQDNVTPERYAELYYEAYHFIKERDPSALVAIAGVAQPTPLRRAYLDRVLAHYLATYGEAMPIDIWTVHAFILREEVDSWGVGIPPGLADTQGQLYEIDDHDNMAIFQQNLHGFRSWLAEYGYQNHPLAVTEYGIIMPADYGFPPERVNSFMMAALDFFLSASSETGYGLESGRLVQWWFWFVLHDVSDTYTNGNLYDPATNQLTTFGQTYANYGR